MALSEQTVRACVRRLLLSRMRLLCTHGFYGLLLMHMRFAVDEVLDTAATDGEQIVFGASFLQELSDRELDFVLMHEVLHVVLRHVRRSERLQKERYNIACDIVVNSTILLENRMDLSSITLRAYGESMHRTPDGREGHLFTAEEVYAMLGKGSLQPHGGGWDDHTRWEECEDPSLQRDIWNKRFRDVCAAIEVRDPGNLHGTLPAFARRLLKEMNSRRTDWRTILNDFIQEEITDYSFLPPDRRFVDAPFFLPDLNVPEERVEDLLFMIDTSGSMSDEMVAVAFAEICSAVDQFDGRLRGWLGFFDSAVAAPKPFSDIGELKKIRPVGGGGTSFDAVFRYVARYMSETPPVSIIILTDGCAPFPEERAAGGIPVLWLINNEKVDPPWGRVARIALPA